MIIQKQLMMFMKIWKIIIQQRKGVLIAFDDMIADMESDLKKLSPKVTELFLRERQHNISLVFILQSYFKVPETIRLYDTLFYYQNS